jgi:hypothetical protein
MDALGALRAKIPTFPGYADADNRRLADEEVRAYLGEALAGLDDRVGTGPLAERYGAVLLRAEFINQSAFRSIETADLSDAQIESMVQADIAAVELADRADSLPDDALPGYLDAVTAALDARDRAMEVSSPLR